MLRVLVPSPSDPHTDYQGEHILEDMIQPPPSDPQYLEVMKAISAKFASAFVSSDPIVVGTLGDSTVAG